METVAENPSSRICAVPLNHPPQTVPPLPQHKFPTYLENPDVSPKARVICEILTRVSPHEVETVLTTTGIKPEPGLVEEVLKLTYGSPSTVVKFFRWAGMIQKHSAYAWNLMVDILGKAGLFEPMWDAIRSMKQEGLLSLQAFVSMFENYCSAGRISEAVMSFDVMDRYGIEPNVVAVNSLLSAICRMDNQTSKALEFFERIKTKIAPDADSFAILLEGWEKEGNAVRAMSTFGEMVIRIGWIPQNMSAYDAFLTTLVRGSQVDEAIKFLQVMKGKNCMPGLKFLSKALDILTEQNDSAHAVLLWDMMLSNGLVPNSIMYNLLIFLLCNNNDIDNAFRFLDEMVFYGAFPDPVTYNLIFRCLTKNKKVREASRFFSEMIKNECSPTHSSCAAAITMFLDEDDPETATEVWGYMIVNGIVPLEKSANALLIGLCNMGRLTQLKRCADSILDKGIKIEGSTMEKLKRAYDKEGASSKAVFDSLYRKWKAP